ncbi:hypothetical protein FRC08_009996 [Ceratobasidium sp. 394]|nr:hypothetical protein FRC08_009996 [Ceratobasidium sp. 394]
MSTLPGQDPTDGNNSATNNRPDLDWFNRDDYERIVEDDAIRYVHKKAGRILRKSTTTWEQIAESRVREHPRETCFPFPNLAQWKLAQWLTTCKASQAKIDELLAMDGIFAETPCFRSASELFEMVENNINGFGGPKWFEQEITLPEAPEEPLTLYLHNIEESADYLAGRPDFAGDIDFEPQVIFELDDKTQIINQMPMGHRWHEILRAAGQHEDAALGGILFGSDITHLTHYAGDVKVHAFYISLANIHKEVRSHTSRRAWMLVAYIPICKWEKTILKTEFRSKQHQKDLPRILNRRAFHLSLEIICEPLREINVHEVVDPEGNIRLIFYILLAYLADLEEQYKISALDKRLIANAPGQHNQELTKATRALLDFLFLAQLPSHTDRTLAAFQTAYDDFHRYKSVWIKNGARQGEKGNVIPHFNIPKLHNIGHLVEQVLAKGTADNYSTETIEHLHIDTVKEPYKATNKKDWQKQTVRGLTRREKIVDFGLWLDWRIKQLEANGPTVDS